MAARFVSRSNIVGLLSLYFAAPIVQDFDSGESQTLTFTAPSAGIVDLASLVLNNAAETQNAAADEIISSGDLSLALRITGISVNNGEWIALKGRNTPVGPMLFGYNRKGDFVDLGCLQVDQNTTIAVTVTFTQTSAQTVLSGLLAFYPSSGVSGGRQTPPVNGPEIIEASPSATITDIDGTTSTLAITFDTSCWFHLDRLVISANGVNVVDQPGDTFDPGDLLDLSQVLISQIALDSLNMNFVVGQGSSPRFPAKAIGPQRGRSFVKPGWFLAEQGTVLTTTLGLIGPAQLDNSIISAAVPVILI